MTKKITALFIALVLALSVCVTMAVSASAATDIFIFDEGGKLTGTELENRNAQSKMLEDNYGYTVMVLVLEETGDLTTFEYGEIVFPELSDSKNGIILVENLSKGTFGISFIGKADGVFSTEQEEVLYTEYNSSLNYDECIERFQLAIEDVIQYKAIPYEENDNASDDNDDYINDDSDSGETIGAVPEEESAEESEESPLLLDLADLLSEKEQTDIEKKLKDFSKEQKMDLAIVTVDDLEGQSIKKFASMVYDEMDYGQGNDKDGAVLVRYINKEKDEKEVYIYASGKAKEIFTEDFTQDVFDAMQEDVEAGKYASAFNTFINKAAEGPKREINWMMLGVFVLVGMTIGLLIIVVIISKNKSIVRKNTASLYTRQGSMMLTGQNDTFIRSHVRKTARPKNNDDDSSGGGRKM